MSAGADGDSGVNVLASSNKTQKAADVACRQSNEIAGESEAPVSIFLRDDGLNLEA